MRNFGGGIGHLNNTPLQQAYRSGPLDPNSEVMAVDEDEEDGTASDLAEYLLASQATSYRTAEPGEPTAYFTPKYTKARLGDIGSEASAPRSVFPGYLPNPMQRELL